MTARTTGAARLGATGAAQLALFTGLFDDAALFPPGNAPMDRAVAAHRSRWSGPDAVLTGPFVCPDTRLTELAGARPAGRPDAAALRIALVVPAGPAALGAALRSAAELTGVRVAAVEIPAVRTPSAGALVAAGLGSSAHDPVPVYLELPLGRHHADAVAALTGTGYRVKIRTGGTVASAFPDEPTLAAAIVACIRHGTAFKLTAGLHHAVRHRDPATGFEHHGVLNVLLAVATALDGAPPGRVAAVLGDRDATGLARTIRTFGHDRVRQVRASFVSVGTCNITEPVADLIALGLLDRETP